MAESRDPRAAELASRVKSRAAGPDGVVPPGDEDGEDDLADVDESDVMDDEIDEDLDDDDLLDLEDEDEDDEDTVWDLDDEAPAES